MPNIDYRHINPPENASFVMQWNMCCIIEWGRPLFKLKNDHSKCGSVTYSSLIGRSLRLELRLIGGWHRAADSTLAVGITIRSNGATHDRVELCDASAGSGNLVYRGRQLATLARSLCRARSTPTAELKL